MTTAHYRQYRARRLGSKCNAREAAGSRPRAFEICFHAGSDQSEWLIAMDSRLREALDAVNLGVFQQSVTHDYSFEGYRGRKCWKSCKGRPKDRPWGRASFRDGFIRYGLVKPKA
jgi:hypothetical protein